MKFYNPLVAKVLLIVSFSLSAFAAEADTPYTFEGGEATSAEQMNADFDAIQAAVNDNNARINATAGMVPLRSIFQGFAAQAVNGSAGLFSMQ